MTMPAERRKQFAEVNAIGVLAGFTVADKTPDVIRLPEATIEASMIPEEAVAGVVAKAKTDATKAKAAKSLPMPGL